MESAAQVQMEFFVESSLEMLTCDFLRCSNCAW